MSSYYELLRHPNWQRKRLEILKRANFRCENCDSDTKILHVHHSYYESKKNPWDYPDHSLHALCEDCHALAEARGIDFKRLLGRLDLAGVQSLSGYGLGIYAYTQPDELISVEDYEVAAGMADWWGLTPEIIIADLQDGMTSGRSLLSLVAIHGSPTKSWLEQQAHRPTDATN